SNPGTAPRSRNPPRRRAVRAQRGGNPRPLRAGRTSKHDRTGRGQHSTGLEPLRVKVIAVTPNLCPSGPGCPWVSTVEGSRVKFGPKRYRVGRLKGGGMGGDLTAATHADWLARADAIRMPHGTQRDTGATFAVVSPRDGQLIASVPAADESDVDRAVAAA